MDGHDPPGGASRTPDGAALADAPASRVGEPTIPRAIRWSPLALAVTALASFVAQSAAQLAAVLTLGTGVRATPVERGPLDIFLITLSGAVALFVVLVLLARRFLHTDLRGLGFRSATRRDIRFAIKAGLALWMLSILANLLSIAAFGPNPQPLVVSFGAHRGPEAFVLDLLTGAVAAPAAEETLYRGLLFAGLAQRLPFVAAASLSALVFGVLHGLGVLAPIFVLGFGLAWVYWRTGTLWAPIVTHALVNTISLAVLFLAPRPPV